MTELQELRDEWLIAATIHSSSSSCSCGSVQAASPATSLPRRVTSEPVSPATYWQNSVLTDRNVRSQMRLVGRGIRTGRLYGDTQHAAGGDERLRDEHLAVVDHDGGRDDDRFGRRGGQPLVNRGEPVLRQHRPRHRQRRIQPGRIGSGTSMRASSTAASTALVPSGRSTAAPMVRVATSSVIVSSGRPVPRHPAPPSHPAASCRSARSRPGAARWSP